MKNSTFVWNSWVNFHNFFSFFFGFSGIFEELNRQFYRSNEVLGPDIPIVFISVDQWF